MSSGILVYCMTILLLVAKTDSWCLFVANALCWLNTALSHTAYVKRKQTCGLLIPPSSFLPPSLPPSSLQRLSSAGSSLGDGLESDDEARRASHNVLERKRRNDLKSSFQVTGFLGEIFSGGANQCFEK